MIQTETKINMLQLMDMLQLKGMGLFNISLHYVNMKYQVSKVNFHSLKMP